MKIILGFLIISFACFTFADDTEEKESKDWEANKENCTPAALLRLRNSLDKITEYSCTIKKNSKTETITVKSEGECTCDLASSGGSGESEHTGNCDTEVTIDKKLSSFSQGSFNIYEQACNRYRDTAQTTEDQQRQQAENQRNMLKESREQCQRNHQDFASQRERKEAEVRQLEADIAKRQHQIIDLNSKTSREEDMYMDEYAKLKDGVRRDLNQYESNQQEINNGFDKAFKEIQLAIETTLIELEQAESGKRDICSQRYNEYKLLEEGCYQRAYDQVSAERDMYYQKLYSGEQEFSSVSEVFANDFETTEQKFVNLLNIKKQRCYDRAIGKTEIVACDLEILEKRDELCQKDKKPQCPTPAAADIELRLKQSLKGVYFTKKGLNAKLKTLYQELEELPTKRKEELALLKQQIEDRKKLFDDQVAQMAREHQQAQVDRFNRVRQLEDEINLKRQEDPSRYFHEHIKYVHNTCCQSPSEASNPLNQLVQQFSKDDQERLNLPNVPNLNQQMVGNPQLCNDLQSYANNPHLVQFMFVKRGQAAPMTSGVATRAGAR